MAEGTMHQWMAGIPYWFCITDQSLTVMGASREAERWLGVNAGPGIRLSVYVPELADAILAKADQQHPFTCVVGGDDPARPALHLIVDRLAGNSRGFVCYQPPAEQIGLPPSFEDRDPFHQHRLTMLGMLVSGVAHDFNNLLTGILGHTSYLRSILPAQGDHADSLVSIEQGARKASLLTRQILDFGRPDTDRPVARVNACSVVWNLCTLMRAVVPPMVTLQVETPSSPLWVLGMDGRIAQIVINLVMNARDAIKGSGSIRVTVEECPSSRLPLDLLQHAIVRRYMQITVSDDGVGMPAEVQEHMFRPFFSKKGGTGEKGIGDASLRSGTGLGLSTVAAIVLASEGRLSVDSAPGQGTTISVVLPLDDFIGEDESDDSPRPELLPRGDERILVMDDEQPVRNVIVMSLEHLGYSVTAVDSGEAAVAAYQSQAIPFDLVILDMLLPDVTGDEVFARIRSMNPRARILVMSGFSPADRVQGLLASGNSAFVQKPFTMVELACRVRECLESSL